VLLGAKVFEFAGFTLDVARGTLRAGDRDVELRPKSFAVLAYLVEHADRLVTKTELVNAIWPDVIVSEESLTHCISEVRNALGDAQQQIIKTAPRRGYRLVAPASQPDVRSAASLRSRAAAPQQLEVSAERHRNAEPALPDRPSIAVLPFENMCGHSDQELLC
jgi:adenylate cyclase